MVASPLHRERGVTDVDVNPKEAGEVHAIAVTPLG
jgi:hypothetical protein